MIDKTRYQNSETELEYRAFQIGISAGLAYDLVFRDALNSDDADTLWADTHARLDLLRKLYGAEPGQCREIVAGEKQ